MKVSKLIKVKEKKQTKKTHQKQTTKTLPPILGYGFELIIQISETALKSPSMHLT